MNVARDPRELGGSCHTCRRVSHRGGRRVEETVGRCPACGAPLTERLAEGVCPGCLVALALEQQESDPDYRVLAVLDATDARTLYLAEDEEARRLVTLDVVRAPAAPAMTPGLFDARVAELVGLRHPAIIPVLGGRITSTGDYCIVAEYAPGRSADAWAASVLPDAGQVMAVIERVGAAIAHAHSRHVVHGRLTPPSVVLRAGHTGTLAVVGGYGVCEGRAIESDDVAGLARLLAALARRPEVAAAVAPVVERVSGRRHEGSFRTVDEFLAALALTRNDDNELRFKP